MADRTPNHRVPTRIGGDVSLPRIAARFVSDQNGSWCPQTYRRYLSLSWYVNVLSNLEGLMGQWEPDGM